MYMLHVTCLNHRFDLQCIFVCIYLHVVCTCFEYIRKILHIQFESIWGIWYRNCEHMHTVQLSLYVYIYMYIYQTLLLQWAAPSFLKRRKLPDVTDIGICTPQTKHFFYGVLQWLISKKRPIYIYICRECITLRTQWWTLPFSRLREHEHDDTVYIVVRRDGMLTFGWDMIEDVSPLFFCWVCFCWVHRRCLAVQFFRWVVLLFLFRLIEDVLLFLTAADRIGHQHRDGLADSRGRRPDQVEQWPSWVAKANARKNLPFWGWFIQPIRMVILGIDYGSGFTTWSKCCCGSFDARIIDVEELQLKDQWCLLLRLSWGVGQYSWCASFFPADDSLKRETMSKDIMAIDLNMYTVLYYIITLYIYIHVLCVCIYVYIQILYIRGLLLLLLLLLLVLLLLFLCFGDCCSRWVLSCFWTLQLFYMFSRSPWLS